MHLTKLTPKHSLNKAYLKEKAVLDTNGIHENRN